MEAEAGGVGNVLRVMVILPGDLGPSAPSTSAHRSKHQVQIWHAYGCLNASGNLMGPGVQEWGADQLLRAVRTISLCLRCHLMGQFWRREGT